MQTQSVPYLAHSHSLHRETFHSKKEEKLSRFAVAQRRQNQSETGVAGYPGITGRIKMESVAGYYRNRWPDVPEYANGAKKGGKMRDVLANSMSPADISKSQNLARECVRKNYKAC